MSDRPIVLITDRLSPEGTALLLDKGYEVIGGGADSNAIALGTLLEQIGNVNGVITDANTPITTEVIEAASDETVAIANNAVGYDNFRDIAAASRRGIALTNTPDVLTAATAEHTLALILTCAKRIVQSYNEIRLGLWSQWEPLGKSRDLSRSTLGFIGCGRIGGQLLNYTLPLFEKVLIYDPHLNPRIIESVPDIYMAKVARVQTLEEALAESDVDTIHCPLIREGDDKTLGLIGTREFEIMSKRICHGRSLPPDLVNCGRGPIVDSNALYEALLEHYIRAAGIDVTDPEPMSKDDPILNFPNLIVTPHTASGGIFTRPDMSVRAATNLIAAIEGRIPPDAINASALVGHPRWAA